MTAPRPDSNGRPDAGFRTIDAVAMIVGIVVGAGIFRTPGLVAGAAGSTTGLMALWVAGGIVSVIGALCYAELASAFPDAGGEYHFLHRAFGRKVAFLFAWARLTVIPTGSIALLAFVFGDYVTELVPFGSSLFYAAVLVVSLTALNVAGLKFGKTVQNVCTVVVICGLAAIIVGGLMVGMPAEPIAMAPAAAVPEADTGGVGVGLAMVFVLLTYGGWNEAAYLSSEVRGGPRRVALSLVGGVAVVTVLYLAVNLAYVRGLGLEGLQASTTVASDLMRAVTGNTGAAIVSALIAAAALTSANATIVTGSRTGYALGRDFRVFRALGRWDPKADAPVPALLVQGTLALVLVAVGGLSRRGFEAMVEYTAPVFWAFFLLTGIALFVLRRREPHAPRPFKVPLYPLTPLIFCASSAWLLYSSVAHARIGAVMGLIVLALGTIPLLADRVRAPVLGTRTREQT